MFYSIIFLMIFSMLMGIYLYWGITRLTADNRQVFAAMPDQSLGTDTFNGVNFTWYGLLSANSLIAAVLLFLILEFSLGTPIFASFGLITLSLCICLPAARIIARIVEKKKHTFTVGGSVFIGILLSPVLIFSMSLIFSNHLLLIPTMAALSVAYALGESLGRLACISFGCCYGKPLSQCNPLLRKLFDKRHMVYGGTTRKACYASNLSGEKLLPIQAVTALIYAATAVLGTGLFLAGKMKSSLVLAITVTQLWRVVSEIFRDDYRGGNIFSAYQFMGLIGVCFILILVNTVPQTSLVIPDIRNGIAGIWNPWVIFACQGLWLIMFRFMGRSSVTGSTVHVHVVSPNT